jgi:hypothetical protein
LPQRYDIIDLFAGISGVSAGFGDCGRFRPALLIDIDETGSGLVYVEASSTSRSCRERHNQQALAKGMVMADFAFSVPWS